VPTRGRLAQLDAREERQVRHSLPERLPGGEPGQPFADPGTHPARQQLQFVIQGKTPDPTGRALHVAASLRARSLSLARIESLREYSALELMIRSTT
jgi:hypothetical protein